MGPTSGQVIEEPSVHLHPLAVVVVVVILSVGEGALNESLPRRGARQ